MGISDISGRLLPIPSAGGGSVDAAQPSRSLAVPLIRERPNESSRELLFQAYGNLAAAQANFGTLTNAVADQPARYVIPPATRARVDSMLLFCPDMVTDVRPYLFARLLVGGDPIAAWGNVAVFPRAGVAAVDFDLSVFLSAGQVLDVFAKNADATNTHFLGVYLRGWQWSQDYVDG